MANVIAFQKLEEGGRNAVCKITGVLDTEIVTPLVIVDAQDFTDPTPQALRIDYLDFSVQPAGLTLKLWWDAPTPLELFTLNDTRSLSFKHRSGLVNNATNPTGNIALTTEGVTNPSNITIVFRMVKMGTGTSGALLWEDPNGFLILEDGSHLALG